MQFKYLAIVTAGLALPFAAHARIPPNPPPSGIVVHLFGPGSITSHVLPTSPGNPPAPTGAETAPDGSTTAGVLPGSEGAGNTGAAQPYIEPTMGEVLRQLFVTGDPNVQPAQEIPPGRAAERP